MASVQLDHVRKIYSNGQVAVHGASFEVADGELMLLHQGAAAFTLWTGQPAPLELMQAKLAEARAGGIRSTEGEPTGSPADGVPAVAGAAD